MVASDVYKIAKLLPKKEIIALFHMLKKDAQPENIIKKPRKKLPDFSVEDALVFLLENHIKK
ncbi:hypothetical protein [Maribacter aurantiacus]|uniref:Uncharacterized protein n=1 Tax=Maribacter aurantiacus TaxID=1882343 RepID=A0A5R8MC75_9FLAO|nr:hypothetical protein [Maribacter aurantiacus]TLF47117.1 hypothetical protein FEK29_04955 [Maribacter aurantiacus]